MSVPAKNYQSQLSQASTFLSSIDADWQQLIQATGTCQLTYKADESPYAALVRAVAYQQLHTKAGDVIFNRFLQQFNGELPPPQTLITHDVEAMRACGFSARKVETIKAIAQNVLDEVIPNREAASQLANAALIERITTIKGIGPWTVQMMLMFTLNRSDVLPVDDLGVREGYKRLKQLDEAPKPKALNLIGETWAPFRSVASWYLWQVPK